MISALLRHWREGFQLSLRMKLVLSLSAIAAMLLASGAISIFEFSRMSDYVSKLIQKNIDAINVSQKLSSASYEYNLDILSVIGDENDSSLPDFDQQAFVRHCDSLTSPSLSLGDATAKGLMDSVRYAYSAYMLTSLELPDVLKSDFIDSREWYFRRLQPQYNRLSQYIDSMTDHITAQLEENSRKYDRGIYRSFIPSIVAICLGMLMVFMFLFFILSNYVTPLSRMRDALTDYKSVNKKYTYTFEGDDELCEINQGIAELTSENQQLRTRIKSLRTAMSHKEENR